jgi:hypothetical protein
MGCLALSSASEMGYQQQKGLLQSDQDVRQLSVVE